MQTAAVTQPATSFPPLSGSARPVSQDRSERIVSTVVIDAPLERVWAALADRASVQDWFGVPGPDWAVPDRNSALDFEDGEFFWCHFDTVLPPEGGEAHLVYRWRWVGVGPAAQVNWDLTALADSTAVTVTETLDNGPADWRSWNGMGWPGILDQLAHYVTTGRRARWTWRRMGPYIQMVMPADSFRVWATLTAVPSLQFWLGRTAGSLDEGRTVSFILGDASGTAELTVVRHVEANQQFPSYQPNLAFQLDRPGWPGTLTGYLWIEPAGLGQSILQVFINGWEIFGSMDAAPADRHILASFWAAAFERLRGMVTAPFADGAIGDDAISGPHSWSR